MDKFKALFIAHAPDADILRHNCMIDTGMYQLFVQVVRSQQEALETVKKLAADEEIHSIILCPGFTHKDVAEIQAAVEGKAAVCVSRSDGPGSRLTSAVMEKVGWFKR